MKAAATPAARDLLRFDERKVEARQRTRTVNVASPSVPGAVESFKRAVDVLDYFWSRKRLGEQEYNAGLRYQIAWERVTASAGGAMDFEKARGGSVPGGPLTAAYMEAAATIAEARKALEPDELAIVHRVIGLNYNLTDVAGQLELHRTTVSAWLRRALGKLSDYWELGKRWEGITRRRKAYVHRGFAPGELQASGEAIPRGKNKAVAHASKGTIKYK
jgi:hypothetical protein